MISQPTPPPDPIQPSASSPNGIAMSVPAPVAAYPADVPHRTLSRGRPRLAGQRARRAAALVPLLVLGLPAVAHAHSIVGRVDSPLPFVAYILGAAIAVGASFVIIAVGDPSPPVEGPTPPPRVVPGWLRVALRVIGLGAWTWIVLQAIVGGTSDADVAFLFLWVYGWVGMPLICAFVGPVWSWIDPFSTLYDIIAWTGRKLGVSGVTAQPWPARLDIWPAVAGFAFFVWLELVAVRAPGSHAIDGDDRIYRHHPAGHGAVRARHMADARGDVQRLVRARGSPGAVRAR